MIKNYKCNVFFSINLSCLVCLKFYIKCIYVSFDMYVSFSICKLPLSLSTLSFISFFSLYSLIFRVSTDLDICFLSSLRCVQQVDTVVVHKCTKSEPLSLFLCNFKPVSYSVTLIENHETFSQGKCLNFKLIRNPELELCINSALTPLCDS